MAPMLGGFVSAHPLHFGYTHHLFMSDISRGSGENDLENPLGCKKPSAKYNVAPGCCAWLSLRSSRRGENERFICSPWDCAHSICVLE